MPWDFLIHEFAIMVLAAKHTFYILTKRPEIGAEFISMNWEAIYAEAKKISASAGTFKNGQHKIAPPNAKMFPFPNLWFGTSPGGPDDYKQSLESLATIPAIVRWISDEPIIGMPMISELINDLKLPSDMKHLIDTKQFNAYHGYNPVFQWGVFGGESGDPKTIRAAQSAWFEKAISDGRALGFAPWIKQEGTLLARALNRIDPKGGNMDEWPLSIRVREKPFIVPGIA